MCGQNKFGGSCKFSIYALGFKHVCRGCWMYESGFWGRERSAENLLSGNPPASVVGSCRGGSRLSLIGSLRRTGSLIPPPPLALAVPAGQT